MGTSSTVTAKMGDGTYRTAYVNFDGYLNGVGRTLVDYYKNQEKVEALLAHGDMSCLYGSPEMTEGHSYETPVPGYCIYYGRDRGETGIECSTGATFEESLRNKGAQGYDYLWDGEQWVIKKGNEFFPVDRMTERGMRE